MLTNNIYNGTRHPKPKNEVQASLIGEFLPTDGEEEPTKTSLHIQTIDNYFSTPPPFKVTTFELEALNNILARVKQPPKFLR